MEGPITTVWGPALWAILHILAQRAGHKKTPLAEDEEKRLWRTLLLSLRTSLPCPKCQKHYSDYLKTHSWAAAFSKKGLEWAQGLQTWLFDLHNHVTAANGREVTFTADRLATTYGGASKGVVVTWKHTLGEHMRRGLVLRIVTREDTLKSIRFIEEIMLGLY